jgi:LacI family transcriptional regulator
MNKKLRIKDIAKLAGVSPGTVDRVIHNRGQVTEENRLNILKIIEDVDYKPNLLARSLANKKKYLFVSLCPEFHQRNDYWRAPDRGIERAAYEINDFNITVKRFYFDQFSVQAFQNKIKEISDLKPDGVLLSPVFREETIAFAQQLDEKQVPYIFIDSNIDGLKNISYLGQNSFQSGYLAARLLSHSLPEKAKIIIARIGGIEPSNQAIRREEGIISFLKQSTGKFDFEHINLDLNNKQNLDYFKQQVQKAEIRGIIVINSKAFEVATIVKGMELSGKQLIGYDLLPENIKYLKEGIISFLIAQRPEEQGYKGIMSLFNHLVTKTHVEQNNFLPIDILTSENIDYYLNYI